MQRIQSLDLARGFTVLFIPAIHSVMLYSKTEVYSSWLGYPLAFIAEGPGGQLLMLLMGIVFTFKKRHSLLNVLIKSLGLLVAGYLLNALKFIVPFSLQALPTAVQRDLHLTPGKELLQLLMIGDILHFAAIAYIVIYGIYQLKEYYKHAALLAAIIVFTAPLVWDSTSTIGIFHYLLQLATGQPPRVFFPLLPWLVYPLIGLVLGYYLQQSEQKTLATCGWVGGVCIAIGFIYSKWRNEHALVGFYRTYPGQTILHIGMVLLALYSWNWLAKHLPVNPFFKVLEYMSRNITEIYIIQWILICWLLPVIGYQVLDLPQSVIACTIVSSIAFSLSYFFYQIKRVTK